eukprot:CAMPEP_0202896368 /NCGR_PEP_ID=MMETSP1392-20130828/5384_1 /ASSEMBLY_ACC=CAM_ASM_000868 /TAXON_ID=225041 /ORGANISM="Chlamydomonas chlamydogama, Strain SAG 11-48b" /LENGTH=217 /DNA_ID=CAMNT_0049581709 /DNA_START=122 /DNA_END=775 /DNA_ORIENTATION=-
MPKYTLHYFAAPGRAEVARLIAVVGGLDWEDKHYGYDDWPAFKAKTPFGQVPVLEVDGKMLGQSAAIERYLAKQAGLLPQGDDWAVAHAEALQGFLTDIMNDIMPTMQIKDLDARIKARQDLLQGATKDKLTRLNAAVEAAGGKHVAGGKLSNVDLAIFVALSQLKSGQYDGIPKDVLSPYPALSSFQQYIAGLEPIKKHYAGITEGSRLAYKPDSA